MIFDEMLGLTWLSMTNMEILGFSMKHLEFLGLTMNNIEILGFNEKNHGDLSLKK